MSAPLSYLQNTLEKYENVLPNSLRTTWQLLGNTIFRRGDGETRRSQQIPTTMRNEPALGGYTWHEYRDSVPQARGLIEAAALQAALQDFTRETADVTITIDFCAKLLRDDNEFRMIFLRCWEKGNLQELHSNGTFRSFVNNFLTTSNSDSSFPQEGLHYSSEQSILRNLQASGNKTLSRLTPRFARLGNDTYETMETYWPRRLLHIPTMTSVERSAQDTYGNVQKPKYGILTYTWGRWERDGPGPALEVTGTPWKIPSIEEWHFTVEAFRRVVQRMGKDVDWAWIDVACVEQRDGNIDTKAVKMDEIGRQFAIFKNAHRVFAWLSRLSTGALEQHLENIQRCGPELEVHKESQFLSEDILRKLDKSLSAIVEDPWFSSLWTLQEITLRNDAVILTQEGNTIRGGLDMVALAKSLNDIRERLIILKQTEPHTTFPPDYGTLSFKIISAIDMAGFPYYSSSNPNAQYALAQYRVTKRPLDRIYAIMQIYNLRVGEAVDPKKTTSLNQLEDEFTAAICSRCPILGQRFVHLQRPPKGNAWRISQHSAVPDRILRYRNPQPSCAIQPDPEGRAIFRGKICSLHTLEQLWGKFIYENPKFSQVDTESPFEQHFEVILDRHTLRHHPVHRDTAQYPLPPTSSRSAPWRIAQELCHHYGTDAVVILELGTLWSGFQYYNQTTRAGLSAPEHFGIIARIARANGGVRYERAGVCVWNPLAAFGEAGERFDDELHWEKDREVVLK